MSTFHTMPSPIEIQSASLDARSLNLRKTIVKILESTGRGHLGSAFSLVEIIRVLYDDVLKDAIEDLAILRAVPNMTIVAPADADGMR